VIIQKIITEKLQQSLSPEYIQVINESHQHNVPDGSESHFKLVIVSKDFEGLRLIQRQRRVYQILEEEMSSSVHALTMQTFSADEWQANQTVVASPQCMGGNKNHQ